MGKFPNPPLLLVGIFVLIFGIVLTGDIKCRNKSIHPGDVCNFGAGKELTYEQMAARPVSKLSTYLIIAVILIAAAVLLGLLRRGTNIPRQNGNWKTFTSVRTFVWLIIVAAGLIPLGIFMSNRPTTCNGQTMGAGDRCVNLKSGSAASYDQVSNAPITQVWLYWGIAAILLIIVVVLLVKQKTPTEAEVAEFTAKMAVARQQILLSRLAPERKQAEVAKFDAQLAAELKRVGAVNPTLVT